VGPPTVRIRRTHRAALPRWNFAYYLATNTADARSTSTSSTTATPAGLAEAMNTALFAAIPDAPESQLVAYAWWHAERNEGPRGSLIGLELVDVPVDVTATGT
jgi:hypothetical protein